MSGFLKRYHVAALLSAIIGIVGVLQANQEVLTQFNPKYGTWVSVAALIVSAFQKAALSVKESESEQK